MRIVIAGGSGFLGGALTAALRHDGHDVTVLTRRVPAPHGAVTWKPDGHVGPWAASIDGTDGIVNLAGESIAGWRWTAARKRSLLDSRVLPTRSLVSAVQHATRPPAVFVQGSAIGYYGARADEIVDEAAAPGDDFLARTCVAWEAAAAPLDGTAVRLARLRTGLVLSRHGGVLPRLLLPFRLGFGGPLGDGRHYMPWVHRDDWVDLVRWLLASPAATGAFIGASPDPVENAVFTATIAHVLRRPHLLRVPAFALRAVLGEMADVVLTGQRAVPARALALGFRFRFQRLESALRDLLAR